MGRDGLTGFFRLIAITLCTIERINTPPRFSRAFEFCAQSTFSAVKNFFFPPRTFFPKNFFPSTTFRHQFSNMCQSTASSPGAGHKGFCGHMRSAGHKLKKAGRRLRDKLAKHGLLGANFKSDYELGELGRKYWTRPEQVDEETYRNSVRAPGSTWWHNCDRKDDSW